MSSLATAKWIYPVGSRQVPGTVGSGGIWMAASAITRSVDWEEALEGAIQEASASGETAPADLALLFASADYGEHLPAMVRRGQSATGAGIVAGCSGQGIIGPERCVEGEAPGSL